MNLYNEKLGIFLEVARGRGDVLPAYGEKSLAEVPRTVLKLFGVDMGRPSLRRELYEPYGKEFKKIVLLFVDGLGWDQFLHSRFCPLFEALSKHGSVSPITTVFPSTTAAAVTTVHTGLTPVEHGLPEWFVYFPELDRIIETLPFKPSGTKTFDSLRKRGVDPRILYDGETVYTRLSQAGIPSYMIIPENLAGSAYSTRAQRGAVSIPYRRASDMFISLRRKLREVKGPAYFFAYWPQVDSVGHEFGPNSSEQRAEISSLSHMVTSEFFGKIDRNTASETLFILCSDHGQIRVQKEKLVFLEDKVKLSEFLKPHSDGSGLILPSGHPRDVLLHVRDNKREDALRALREGLDGIAEVVPMQDAFRRMLFGDRIPSDRFVERVGDILLLPYGHTCLWNRGFSKDPDVSKGIHGGLSQEEMLIPFAIAHMSDLCS